MLSRDELVQLATFATAWKFEPANKRPIGYEEFHKEILCPAHVLLMEYSAEEEPRIYEEMVSRQEAQNMSEIRFPEPRMKNANGGSWYRADEVDGWKQ